MNRWSFIKRFGKITYDDFMRFAQQFCSAVDSCYESPSVVIVRFYEQLPRSITTIHQFGLNEWLAEYNKSKQLAEIIELENVTKELFDKAANIQLDIRPIDDAKAPLYTFGHLECKGLLNRHLVYYVQPEEVGEVVKALHLNKQRPSVLRFGIGDGYEHCHRVSIH